MARSLPHRGRRLGLRAVPLMLVSALLLVAGCGSGDDTGAKVELRFSWWGSDSRHAYTQELIDLYESQHPNVTIKADYTGWADYWNKLATSVAAGDSPDIIQMDARYIREYADRGALADLTPYLGSTIDNANFDPSVADAGKIGDETYSITVGVNALALVANPEMFKAAGVPMPDDSTWTWEQLRETAVAISEGTPDDTFGLQDPGFYDNALEIFARQQGSGGIYNADGELAITKEILTKWFTYIQSLGDAGATPPASVSVEVQNGSVDQSLLATNKGALGVWWTNQLPALTEAAGTSLQLLRLPGDAAKAGTYFKPGMMWSIGEKSEHPKEAADFVNFLLNDSEAAKTMLVDRGMPINLELRAAINADLTPADQLSAAFLEKISPTIGDPAIIPPMGAGQVDTIVLNINEQVVFKKITPEQAAEQFLKQAGAAIS